MLAFACRCGPEPYPQVLELIHKVPTTREELRCVGSWRGAVSPFLF